MLVPPVPETPLARTWTRHIT